MTMSEDDYGDAEELGIDV